LLIELGHRASFEGIFGVPRIGYDPVEVAPGVHAMNLDFENALQDYMAQHIRVRQLSRAIMNNRTLQKFFHAAPSVSEVATLNKLSSLEAAREGSRPVWDPILVDLDATGHALMLLNLPRVMDGLIGDGPMRRLVDGFSSLLKDPNRTVLNLVTLPKELPAHETEELYTKLRDHHDVALALGTLFVNQVPASPLRTGLLPHLPALRAAAQAAGDTVLVDACELTRRNVAAHEAARAQLARLRRTIPLPVVELPRHPAGIGSDNIAHLGRRAVVLLEDLGTEAAS
jgi:anion-transporting  ArsA/GET3 family ATPase